MYAISGNIMKSFRAGNNRKGFWDIYRTENTVVMQLYLVSYELGGNLQKNIPRTCFQSMSLLNIETTRRKRENINKKRIDCWSY